MARLLVAGIVGLCVVTALVLDAVRWAHRVPPASLDAAAREVRDRYRVGDLVAVEPYTQSGPRERLGDLPLVELRAVRPDDVRAYQRVHLLGLDALGAKPEHEAELRSLGEVEREQAWSGVRLVTLRVRDADRTLFSLREGLERAVVSARYADGTRAACNRFSDEGWRCPRNPDWSYVGRITATVDAEPRACVWTHPIEAGGALSIELPVLEGVERPVEVVLGTGFTASGARAARAPVDVRVTSGATELYATRHPVSPEWRWRRFGATSSGPIAVEVSSSDNGAAHFCLDLRVVEARP